MDFLGARDARPVQLQRDDVYMTYSKAQYLGLIANELITNSYKHGTASRGPHLATLKLKRQSNGNTLLHYEDYGPGPSDEAVMEALAPGRPSEGGLSQVVALARELKGKPQISNRDGLCFSFEVPAKLTRPAPESTTAGD